MPGACTCSDRLASRNTVTLEASRYIVHVLQMAAAVVMAAVVVGTMIADTYEHDDED